MAYIAGAETNRPKAGLFFGAGLIRTAECSEKFHPYEDKSGKVVQAAKIVRKMEENKTWQQPTKR